MGIFAVFWQDRTIFFTLFSLDKSAVLWYDILYLNGVILPKCACRRENDPIFRPFKRFLTAQRPCGFCGEEECARVELVRNVTELLSGEGTLPEYPLNRTRLRSEMICRRKRK